MILMWCDVHVSRTPHRFRLLDLLKLSVHMRGVGSSVTSWRHPDQNIVHPNKTCDNRDIP